MMADLPPLRLDELAEFDLRHVQILTVNNRHARRVLTEFSAALGADRPVMAAPNVLSLSAWMRQWVERLSFMPDAPLANHALDSFGAQLLWRRVISEQEADNGLLDIDQAARLAADADRLMDDWQLSVPDYEETLDFQRFKSWRSAYRDALQRDGMDDGNLAAGHVCKALQDGVLRLDYGTVVLAGFNEIHPRLQSMLCALQEQGVILRRLVVDPAGAQQVRRIQASTPDDEWRLAAQWAADKLAADPQGHYAIIAPQLEGNLALAHRVLTAELGVDQQGRPVPYNVALARSLADWPLAHAALAWLTLFGRWASDGRCQPALVGQALLAGHCTAHRDEEGGRAAVDAHWRNRGRLSITQQEFCDSLDRYSPRLAGAWRECQPALGDLPNRASLMQWSRHFRDLLGAIGFPGVPALDSHAYQVAEAVDGLFDSVSRQSVVAGQVSMNTAIGLLRRMARETLFQPERDPSSRLDILGLLESEGGRWDGIWVLGLTDEVLPAVPKPNPFIPISVLRAAQAPRATPERELEWARNMYASLLAAAPEICFSHAHMEGERELRPSPCIADLPLVVAQPALHVSPAAALEYVVDDQGPPLAVPTRVSGGVGVLDTQVRNPLWAFARYRLGARQLPPHADTLPQNVRGLLLHRAMELLWRMMEDQAGLRRASDLGTLEQLVQDAVDQAADEELSDYSPTLRRLECQRSITAIHQWMAMELQRPPFRVAAVEDARQWTQGYLSLSLRVDRVDELDDGRLVVIDYKTGAGNLTPRADWMRDAPVNLQLPFYAAMLAQEPGQVAALALVKLHARECRAAGVADPDAAFDGVDPHTTWPRFADMDWQSLTQAWSAQINAAAADFARGYAANRCYRASDLNYCDVLPFLRLNEEYGDCDEAAQ